MPSDVSQTFIAMNVAPYVSLQDQWRIVVEMPPPARQWEIAKQLEPEYDICLYGWVYCYAAQNQAVAKSRYKQHDPLGESLFALPVNVIDPHKGEDQLGLSIHRSPCSGP